MSKGLLNNLTLTDDQTPRGKAKLGFRDKETTDVFESFYTLQLARKTLERAGIVLYSFASCHKAFVAHKEAYIELLKMLQAENWQDNTELRGSTNYLIPDRPRANLLSNLSTPRTNSDSAHATKLKFLHSEEIQLYTWPFSFT